MQRILRNFAAALLAVALLCTQNAHLPVLQVAAWTGMIISYAQEDGIAAAISETFDGAHPCKLCCAIKKAEAKTHEQLDSAPVPPRPLATPPDVVSPLPSRTVVTIAYTERQQPREQFNLPPPVPPPRTQS